MLQYKTKLVRQIRVDTGTQVLICRYDFENKLLFFQNRSKDCEMSVDEFLHKVTDTINACKEKGYKISCVDVPANNKWI